MEIWIGYGFKINEVIFMTWYKNMTEQQRKDFDRVIGVSIIGVFLVVLIPIVFHLI